jgi:hypothetical protein
MAVVSDTAEVSYLTSALAGSALGTEAGFS